MHMYEYLYYIASQKGALVFMCTLYCFEMFDIIRERVKKTLFLYQVAIRYGKVDSKGNLLFDD